MDDESPSAALDEDSPEELETTVTSMAKETQEITGIEISNGSQKAPTQTGEMPTGSISAEPETEKTEKTPNDRKAGAMALSEGFKLLMEVFMDYKPLGEQGKYVTMVRRAIWQDSELVEQDPTGGASQTPIRSGKTSNATGNSNPSVAALLVAIAFCVGML